MVTGLVLRHYPAGGAELLVAVVLADRADQDGSNIYYSVETIAKLARISRRSTFVYLKRMQDSGWLVRTKGGPGRGKTATYRIPIERIPQGVVGLVQDLHLLPKKVQSDAQKVQSDALKGEVGCTQYGFKDGFKDGVGKKTEKQKTSRQVTERLMANLRRAIKQ